MFTVGLSTCGKPYGEELFAAYRAAGIGEMEISLSKAKCDGFDFENAAALSSAYGVKLHSFHLPFMPFDEIDISSPPLSRGTVGYLSELIGRSAPAKIPYFIVHPSGEPIADGDRALRMKTAKASLKFLAEAAAQVGSVIAVEDLPRTCLGRNSDEMLELLSADDRLRVCFDTNHLLTEPIPSFIEKCGASIVTTHVSDYDFSDEKHWLPGDGAVNWREVVLALEKAGYRGAWLYEVGFKPSSPTGGNRELTCADFVLNAEEIFRSV